MRKSLCLLLGASALHIVSVFVIVLVFAIVIVLIWPVIVLVWVVSIGAHSFNIF